MGRTCSSSVSGVQLMGWSSITVRTVFSPSAPPLRASVWMTSRKVSMPTSSPWSITASEPMSNCDMVSTARCRVSIGWVV